MIKVINDLLFVYGTLLSTDNEFGRYLKNNSVFFSEGRFKGRLYDIGEYPGAITGTNNDYGIKGTICRLTSPDVLKVMDDYEGFGDDQEQPNLYIRKLLPVQTPKGLTDCWVYLYNLPIEGLTEIESGDYAAFKRGHK